MAGPATLDSLDIRILTQLQQDAATPIGQIADIVGLSQNACWRRIKRLEEDGFIQKRVALLDAAKIGAGITVFVRLKLMEHREDWLDRLGAAIDAMPEAVEFCRLNGEFDYLLKLQIPDIAAYDRLYRKLILAARFSDVRANFAMEVLKRTTALPLDNAPRS